MTRISKSQSGVKPPGGPALPLRRSLSLPLFLSLPPLLPLLVAGCAVESSGSPPSFVSMTASCEGASSWTFNASVQDPDGVDDVALVYVDVYDGLLSTTQAVGSIDLANQSGGDWSITVDADDTNALGECSRSTDFAFEFWAIDFSEQRVSGAIDL